MRSSKENIHQLLAMLDNPDAYTEQEIQDIINRDEDTRETYRMMVEAKRSSHCKNNKPIDIDAAWKQLSEKLIVESEEFSTSQPYSQFSIFNSQIRKIAASFIGVLLVSGIAFAAIHIVRQYQNTETSKAEVTQSVTKPVTKAPANTIDKDTIIVQPIIYDNIPLEKMLPEIATHYDVKVTFVNDEARGLRFRFVWNPKQDIDQVVSDLNQFERLKVTMKDKVITVE